VYVKTCCEEVCRKVAGDEYADAGLWTRLVVRFHLWRCGDCAEYARQLRDLGDSVREVVAGSEPQAAALRQVRGEVVEALRRRAEASTPEPSAHGDPSGSLPTDADPGGSR